jgi:formylglycine-generating enzyme required for sulfatase activity
LIVRERLRIFIFVSLPALAVLGCGLYAQGPSSAPLKNALGMEFVKIPAGDFMMGCSTGDDRCNPDETPRHRVRITRSFEIGRYEVMQAQWTALMQTNPAAARATAVRWRPSANSRLWNSSPN